MEVYARVAVAAIITGRSASKSLDAELGPSPVAALRVVADGVVRAEASPVRDGTVLPCLLGEAHLDLEALDRRHFDHKVPEAHEVKTKNY